MSRNKYFASSLSLFPVPTEQFAPWVAEAGFDGAEVCVFSSMQSAQKIQQVRHALACSHLEVRWHQSWSLQDDPNAWQNYLLAAFGMLQPKGYSVKEMFEHVPDEEVCVVNPDHWADVVANRRKYVMQTCCIMGRSGKLVVDWNEYLRLVRDHDLSVVFDTQHYLEMCNGEIGVNKLPRDPARLLDQLAEGWSLLSGRVKEIHVVDFDPRLGHANGRNVFLGDGVLPLQQFADLVARSGWSGVVTPEVAPIKLLQSSGSSNRLRTLYDRVKVFG